MTHGVTRRAAIAAGAATAAVFAVADKASAAPAGPAVQAPGQPPAIEANGPKRVQRVYDRQKTRAGGRWHSHIAALNPDGSATEIVADDADFVINGYSVQKLAVATAVLDKVDRGELTLGTLTPLSADIIAGGSGIYHLHRVYGDQITVANFLTAMLLVSDNTAVRLCGRFVPALELNEILAAKGFVHTRVEPVANPNRFFLGVTTPREMHQLLTRLANKTLLSTCSCDFLLSILRWINGYHDGVRREMSSDERSRVATKYGADFNTLGGSRHEAGIMFGTDGAPVLTYSMFCDAHPDQNNYGATHPVVQAHSVIGRVLFDTIAIAAAPSAKSHHTVPKFQPYKGD